MRYKITAGMLAAMVLSSCNAFLDRFPYDSIDAGKAYSSKSLAESDVIGVYSNLKSDYNAKHLKNWDFYASPLDHETEEGFLRGLALPGDNMFKAQWQRYYEGIRRANDVIASMHGVPDMDQELQECRVAECKILRAWWYLRLNTLWQGVPVYLENVAATEYTRPRSSAEAVWRQIITDCTEAIETQSLPDKYPAASSDYGRVTRGTAYALRGKAHMWLKEWTEAEADFKSVGDCGYALFEGRYGDLFTVENERCDEMVFSVQMIDRAGQGSAFTFEYGNYASAGGGVSQVTLNTEFVESYPNADGTPFDWDRYIPGYNAMSPEARRVFFLRDGLDKTEQTDEATKGADMSQYLVSGNEARLKAAFAGRDPRLAAVCITPYSTYEGVSSGTPQTFTLRFPYKSETAPYYDIRTFAQTRMYYLLRKFVPRGNEFVTQMQNPIDAPVIRYADVLLCLAECLNEQGRTDEATIYVNRVRQRGGNGMPAYRGMNTEQLRKTIRDEKRWELVGEMQLYYEELRWGTWKEDKFHEGSGRTQCWGEMVYPYIYGGDKYLKWPIPQIEIEKNRALEHDQNEGW